MLDWSKALDAAKNETLPAVTIAAPAIIAHDAKAVSVHHAVKLSAVEMPELEYHELLMNSADVTIGDW